MRQILSVPRNLLPGSPAADAPPPCLLNPPSPKRSEPRNTLFTGSSRVAELLATDLRGKIKLEDAGFDWKILGPDVPQKWVSDETTRGPPQTTFDFLR